MPHVPGTPGKLEIIRRQPKISRCASLAAARWETRKVGWPGRILSMGADLWQEILAASPCKCARIMRRTPWGKWCHDKKLADWQIRYFGGKRKKKKRNWDPWRRGGRTVRYHTGTLVPDAFIGNKSFGRSHVLQRSFARYSNHVHDAIPNRSGKVGGQT